MNFNELVEFGVISDTEYPYSKQGVLAYRSLKSSFDFLIKTIILYLAFKFVISPMFSPKPKVNADGLNVATSITTTPNGESGNVSQFDLTKYFGDWVNERIQDIPKPEPLAGSDNLVSGNFFETALLFVINVALVLTVIYFVFCAIRYVYLLIKRQRMYEREVFANDRRAESLRKNILRVTEAKSRLKILKKKIDKENEGDGTASLESISDLVAHKAFMDMVVCVNTRQDLLSEQISRRYIIFVEIPAEVEASKKTVQKCENLNLVATRIEKGVVAFGEMLMSQDRSLIYFEDDIVVPDKYVVVEVEEETTSGVYQYSFPLSNFVDRRAELEAKKAGSMQWTEKTGISMDVLLTTSNFMATRLSAMPSSATATYIYDLSTETSGGKTGNLDGLGKTIDKFLGIEGTNVFIKVGNLHVVIPLPKEYVVSADVPTMYREVFGIDAL